MDIEAPRWAVSPLVRRAAVGLGVAIGAGSAIAPAPAPAAEASPPAARSPLQEDPPPGGGCPDCAPADGDAECEASPLTGREVARNDIVTSRGEDLGDVILQYHDTYRCVRAIVLMSPAASGCRVWAGVYKPSTHQLNGSATGGPGVAKTATWWVKDAGIKQKAMGQKWCGSRVIARGGTTTY